MENKPGNKPTPENGSKGNPWTSDNFPNEWENNPGKFANHFFRKGNGEIFQFDREGKSNQRGNWRGTKHEGRGENKGGATRLKKLASGEISVAPLTGEKETDADFLARKSLVEKGRLAIKAIAPLISVKTLASPATKITRPLNEVEIKARLEAMPEVARDYVAPLLKLEMVTEEVPARDGATVFLSELTGTEILAEKEESSAVQLMLDCVRAALRAS